MSAESTPLDAYETVLADLKAKRDQMDKMIAFLEGLRAGSSTAAVPAQASAAQPAEGAGAYLGLSIPEAAKKLLNARRVPMRNPEIWAALKAGGMHLNSAEPVNTIGSVLTRRFSDVGDIVRIGRGTWGLREWYPNRSFKSEKGAEETKASEKPEK